MSAAFVVRLVERVPKHRNYKIFFDNWFSSVPLVGKLKDEGILCLSTVQANRLKGCLLKDDKQMKKDGRGTSDFCVEEGTNSVAIKWYDNKPVHLLSNYVGIEQLDTCKRWDGKLLKNVEIDRPFAIAEYNKYMGGVDLSDTFMSLYKIDVKSRIFYMRLFFYILDVTVTNAWVLYSRVQSREPVQSRKTMTLLDFKEDVAAGLMSSNLSVCKRGGPSTSTSPAPKSKVFNSQPADSIRFDNVFQVQ